MAEGPNMQLILNTLATISEDLATELIMSTTVGEYESLETVVNHLTKAVGLLTDAEIEAPYAVTELIRNYTEQCKLHSSHQ